MQHNLRLIYFVLALASNIVFVGCTEMRSPDELGRTKEQVDSIASNRSSLENNAGVDYVTYRAIFTTINEKLYMV